MPTFRRGSDGLFLRAAKSVLDQSFDDLELIIVDDASTDGTADQIRGLMRADDRVSCLRHPRNVGLPAVSEYEAYRRARGDLISFAFDDFIFEPYAVSHLIDLMQAEGHDVVHGYFHIRDGTGHDHVLGKDLPGHDRLLYTNFLGNASVVLRREVIEQVGLYDPHVAVSRICDWDLWRRVHRRYAMKTVDVLVGTELGLGRADSLGNSYPMHGEVMEDFMTVERDQLLTPDTFEAREILDVEGPLSWAAQRYLQEARGFFTQKFWYPAEAAAKPALRKATPAEPTPPANPLKPIVTLFGDMGPSLSLYWLDGGASTLRDLHFVEPTGYHIYEVSRLVRSDAVIFVRDIFHPRHATALQLCDSLAIPKWYFVDDNFPLLAAEIPEFAAYNVDNLRGTLASFAGVIVTSEPLLDYFRDNALHDTLRLVAPVFNEKLRAKCDDLHGRERGVSDDDLRLAFFGGSFRRPDLFSHVVPALGDFGGKSTLLLRADASDAPKLPSNVRLQAGGSSPFFTGFLENWSRFGADVVVHPPGHTSNIDYKSSNAVLVSLYLGAVPILTEEEAYRDWTGDMGVEKIRGSRRDWLRAFERLADPVYRRDKLKVLTESCRERFAAGPTEAVLHDVTAGLRPLAADEAARRYRAMMVDGVERLGSSERALHAERVALAGEREERATLVSQWTAEQAKAHECAYIEGVAAGAAERERVRADVIALSRELERLRQETPIVQGELARLRSELERAQAAAAQPA